MYMTTERFIKFRLLNSAHLQYIQYIQAYNPHINILSNVHKNNINFVKVKSYFVKAK